MSLAKLHITERSRKEWKCQSCGDVIPKGSRVIRFTVGYRGRPQERCSKSECFPKPSERESSLVAEVYAAQESMDLSGAQNGDDIERALQDVRDACESVASQYQENPMFENNYDMQERADMLESAGSELDNWNDGIDEEPTEEDRESWGDHPTFEHAHEAWLEEAREAAQSAVDQMEVP